MKKPSIYLDTSIISALWHESPDVSMLARRFHTREWWDMALMVSPEAIPQVRFGQAIRRTR